MKQIVIIINVLLFLFFAIPSSAQLETGVSYNWKDKKVQLHLDNNANVDSIICVFIPEQTCFDYENDYAVITGWPDRSDVFTGYFDGWSVYNAQDMNYPPKPKHPDKFVIEPGQSFTSNINMDKFVKPFEVTYRLRCMKRNPPKGSKTGDWLYKCGYVGVKHLEVSETFNTDSHKSVPEGMLLSYVALDSIAQKLYFHLKNASDSITYEFEEAIKNWSWKNVADNRMIVSDYKTSKVVSENTLIDWEKGHLLLKPGMEYTKEISVTDLPKKFWMEYQFQYNKWVCNGIRTSDNKENYTLIGEGKIRAKEVFTH